MGEVESTTWVSKPSNAWGAGNLYFPRKETTRLIYQNLKVDSVRKSKNFLKLLKRFKKNSV